MNARRILIPALAALIFAAPALADRDEQERRRIEDRIEWLKEKLAQEQQRLTEIDQLLLQAERRRVGTDPGPIASTGNEVKPDTVLQRGQVLQVEWGG